MKLHIKRRRDDTEGLTGSDYLFLLDGHDISEALIEFSLKMGADKINACTITFMPDDMVVDADAIAALTAVVGEEKVVNLSQLISSQIGCSRSEARRILAQGGVKKDGSVVKDLDLPESQVSGAEFQIGTRRTFKIEYHSLFVQMARAQEGEVVKWARQALPLVDKRVAGVELSDDRGLLKFRLTSGLPDLLRLHLEAMDGVEEFELKPGNIEIDQSELLSR